MTEPVPEGEYDTHLIASRVMYELLGRRWVWPRLRTIEVHPLARQIFLSGRPVYQLLAVTDPNGDSIDLAEIELFNGYNLRLPRSLVQRYGYVHPSYGGGIYGAGFACRADLEIEVDYTYGSPPPEQVRYAIDVLAAEMDKAIDGASDCKLPKRVTSISRQGISMAIIDPMDYLEKGRTGVPEVDQAIMVFNRGNAKSRARVFTGTNTPPRRIMTEVAVEP